MIYPKNLPEKGIIKILVRFDGYSDNFQNDSRRKLSGETSNKNEKNIPDEIKKKGFILEPKDFSLMKKVFGIRGRAIGASHTYRYNIEGKDNEEFINSLSEVMKDMLTTKMWRNYEIYLMDKVKID